MDTISLNAIGYFVDESSKTIPVDKWESSKISVATVDEDGVILIKAAGSARITAYFKNMKVKAKLKVK